MSETTDIRWFHSINLGDEITAGFKSHDMLQQEADVVFSYPIKDKSVLDVGAWDGFFSFEAERRGASRVTATDWFCWGGPGWGTQNAFKYARGRLNSKVQDIEIDVPDITVDNVGIHDVVMMSGVIYHVKDPITILETVSKVTGECLIIETMVGLVDVKQPAMLYYAAMDYNLDPTNYWAPNPPCMIEMLKRCGFRSVLTCAHPTNPLTDPTNPRAYFFAIR